MYTEEIYSSYSVLNFFITIIIYDSRLVQHHKKWYGYAFYVSFRLIPPLESQFRLYCLSKIGRHFWKASLFESLFNNNIAHQSLIGLNDISTKMYFFVNHLNAEHNEQM